MIAGRKRQPTIGNSILGMACQRPGPGPVTKERGRWCLRLAALAVALSAGWLAIMPAAAKPATRR